MIIIYVYWFELFSQVSDVANGPLVKTLRNYIILRCKYAVELLVNFEHLPYDNCVKTVKYWWKEITFNFEWYKMHPNEVLRMLKLIIDWVINNKTIYFNLF